MTAIRVCFCHCAVVGVFLYLGIHHLQKKLFDHPTTCMVGGVVKAKRSQLRKRAAPSSEDENAESKDHDSDAR